MPSRFLDEVHSAGHTLGSQSQRAESSFVSYDSEAEEEDDDTSDYDSDSF